MPRLRLDDYGDAPCRRYGAAGNGLRNNHCTYVEDTVPRTQREKDDRFDMYRDERPRMHGHPSARPKIRGSHEPRQLWFIACIICAFGVFCLFSDSFVLDYYYYNLRMASFEVIIGAAMEPDAFPKQVILMSAIPIVFIVMFSLFAYHKEMTFEKLSLALIALSVMVIVIQLYLTVQISKMKIGGSYGATPGYGVFIEIACAVGLIIVIVCQRILGTAVVKKEGW